MAKPVAKQAEPKPKAANTKSETKLETKSEIKSETKSENKSPPAKKAPAAAAKKKPRQAPTIEAVPSDEEEQTVEEWEE